MSFRLRECPHDVYIKGLCGNCGVRLDPPQQSSSVSMIHSVPELKVSTQYAKEIGRADQDRLINERKLVLLVDLDQTVLHTTHETVRNDPNVHSFQLFPGHPIYSTKLRPYLKEFLDEMSKIYELHIFTFGCRMYAHKIASIIDPEKKYFGHRILSRDESVDQYYKRGNLNNLFPCGDAMVCIIDDRADVWHGAGNLIQVKPYTYFESSISDGAMLANQAEEEESLARDVDQLSALIGLDTSESDVGKKRNADEREEPKSKKPRLGGDTETANANQDVETDNPETTDQSHEDSSSSSTEQDPSKITSPADSKTSSDECEDNTSDDNDEVSNNEDDTDEKVVIREDPDTHLQDLPAILNRIHDKWYMELDEQRKYLVEGETYKLPDIKDIIKKYLRRKS